MQLLAFLTVSTLVWKAPASAGQLPVDSKASAITVRVFKSGLFSALAHDHTISAPIARGSVHTDPHKVELYINAAALRVRDSEASEKDQVKIQETMTGPKVLDSERFPQIVFRSTAAKRIGPDSWQVNGELTLHGQTRPVTVAVKESAGRYSGSTVLKQKDFGIKPVRIAGGTVKIKDEIHIEFDIRLAR